MKFETACGISTVLGSLLIGRLDVLIIYEVSKRACFLECLGN